VSPALRVPKKRGITISSMYSVGVNFAAAYTPETTRFHPPCFGTMHLRCFLR